MSGSVYFIRNKDLYKIGITKNFNQRMKVLKPDEIIKVLKINDYKEIEKKLHNKYKKMRIPQTEYFRLEKSQISTCKKLLSIYNYRRSKCNPFIIALLTAYISPLICIIYGIRHRSLKLMLIAFLTMLFSIYLYPIIDLTTLNQFVINSALGWLTYLIARDNKNKAFR